ncbi:uncharacterized protein PITG_01279 [Phytophthora infestans T30-4]|uniref:Transmembrane protein n=1 Tax=Phytophthora infestans (strain T30-4) TaxID=403677 RepID=D0MV39_PHYIT|nr:uncharacterized protein PITG_01279 [Phytophthora infestans T30-4]EEY61035.1 conserved hypothetical protein [Phytophthora infestans T30-4]|eukprot:XP_002907952.1 conserved hypothetical protein [Phytophthora infestans T30-4]
MLESLLRARLLYGAVAMSAGVFVFSFLQEREEMEDQEIELAERPVSTELFFQAMENMPQLSPQQRLEMRRFWRNLTNKKQLRRLSIGSSDSLDAEQEINTELVVRDVQLFAQEYKRVFPDIFPEKQVLDAAEKAADVADQHSTAWSDIVGSTSTMIVSTGKRLNHIAKDTKDEVQSVMHRTVRKVLERALDIVAARLKQTLKDPDMPSYLKTNIDIGIEQFMPDVKMEIFRKTRELFGQDPGTNEDGGAGVVPVTSRRFGLFRRARGHILHHLFPHDKTIWRSFKDPWWILYTSVGLLPDKTNEHQLCQFIVGFKAAQFITLGIMHMMLGVFMYVKCVTQGSMLACQSGGGPALSDGTACFFVLQIVLVWAAFFRLPYTVRPQETALYRTKSMEMRERGAFRDAFGNEVHLDRGGYLMKFCGYETVSFIIIMALAGLVLWLPLETWQRQALFYWIRTAYGLFSFPFLAFKIPVLANVLMHTRQMGYNEQGDTVRFAVKKRLE